MSCFLLLANEEQFVNKYVFMGQVSSSYIQRLGLARFKVVRANKSTYLLLRTVSWSVLTLYCAAHCGCVTEVYDHVKHAVQAAGYWCTCSVRLAVQSASTQGRDV